MSGLFATGHAVDLVFAFLVVEAAALIALRQGFKGATANVIVAVLPGAFLLLALRASLTGAGWPWIALWLAFSLPAHLADLWRRPP